MLKLIKTWLCKRDNDPFDDNFVSWWKTTKHYDSADIHTYTAIQWGEVVKEAYKAGRQSQP